MPAALPFFPVPMTNLRLTLSYDGTDFAGWQVQPNQRTVQDEVEKGIENLTGERVRVMCAGRTDAGVHAISQVINFRTSSSIPPDKWRPALQTRLPPDIVIRTAEGVSEDFHATYSAKSKRYRYLILNSRVDNPFLRRFAWRLGYRLNASDMHRAAQVLVGTHDFRSFESNWPNKASSVRSVYDVAVRRIRQHDLFLPKALLTAEGTEEAPDEPLVCLEIEANGFLYNMVRSIVGTLVNIGRGTWPVESMKRILESMHRLHAGDTSPAQGLFLATANYDRDMGGEPGVPDEGDAAAE